MSEQAKPFDDENVVVSHQKKVYNIPKLEDITPNTIPTLLQTLFDILNQNEEEKYQLHLENQRLKNDICDIQDDLDALFSDIKYHNARHTKMKSRVTALEDDVDDVFDFFDVIGVEIPKSSKLAKEMENIETGNESDDDTCNIVDKKKICKNNKIPDEDIIPETDLSTKPVLADVSTPAPIKKSPFAKKSAFDITTSTPEPDVQTSASKPQTQTFVKRDITTEKLIDVKAQETLTTNIVSPTATTTNAPEEPNTHISNTSASPYELTPGARRLMRNLIYHAAPKEIREGHDKLYDVVERVRREERELIDSLNQQESLEGQYQHQQHQQRRHYSQHQQYNRPDSQSFDRNKFGSNTPSQGYPTPYNKNIRGVSEAFPEGRPWLRSSGGSSGGRQQYNSQSQNYQSRSGRRHQRHNDIGSPLYVDYDGNYIDQSALSQNLHTAEKKWTPKSLQSGQHSETAAVTTVTPVVSTSNSSESSSPITTTATTITEVTPKSFEYTTEELKNSDALTAFGRSTLNRLAESTLPIFTTKLSDQICQIEYCASLEPFMSVLFVKAMHDPSFAKLYATLAYNIIQELNKREKKFVDVIENKNVTFQQMLVRECHNIYEKLFIDHEKTADVNQDGTAVSEDKAIVLTSAQQLEIDIARKHFQNASRFFGELYVQNVLISGIICYMLELEVLKEHRKEEDIEAMITLIKLVGQKLSDTRDKNNNPAVSEKITTTLNSYMTLFEEIIEKNTYSKRLIFMVEDIITLWESMWKGKRGQKRNRKMRRKH